MSVHVNNDHANTRKEHCGTTVADLIGLVLRYQVDIVTGIGTKLEDILKNAATML